MLCTRGMPKPTVTQARISWKWQSEIHKYQYTRPQFFDLPGMHAKSPPLSILVYGTHSCTKEDVVLKHNFRRACTVWSQVCVAVGTNWTQHGNHERAGDKWVTWQLHSVVRHPASSQHSKCSSGSLVERSCTASSMRVPIHRCPEGGPRPAHISAHSHQCEHQCFCVKNQTKYWIRWSGKEFNEIMKTNNYQGDLPDLSAWKKPLMNTDSELINSWDTLHQRVPDPTIIRPYNRN